MRRRAVLAAIVAAGCSAALAAQVFRGGTDVVLLSVVVTDGAGRNVPRLTKADFQIYEDNVAQEILHFSDQPLPISLSLLIDTSTSMDPKLPIAQQAAIGFVRLLGKDDVAQIMDFDSQTKILAPFTHDKAVLETAIKQMKAGGSTSLYNAIYTSLSELKRQRAQTRGELRRQAIVLLSDGQDTTSILQYEDVLELSKRSEVIVYAIGLVTKDSSPSAGWNEAEFVLKTLTRDTGGRAFFVNDPNQLPAIYVQISEELSNQYAVGYQSKNTKRDGAWRRITMQVLRGDAIPRTRAGYFAPSTPR